MVQPRTASEAVKKPIRLWFLQVISVLVLAWNAYFLTTGLLANGGPQSVDDFLWFFSCLLSVLFALAMVLTTQRWAPRPEASAPIAALLALGVRLGSDVEAQLQADPGRRHTNAQLVGAGIYLALMLFFVVSMLVHRRTRAYLRGAGPGGERQPAAVT